MCNKKNGDIVSPFFFDFPFPHDGYGKSSFTFQPRLLDEASCPASLCWTWKREELIMQPLLLSTPNHILFLKVHGNSVHYRNNY